MFEVSLAVKIARGFFDDIYRDEDIQNLMLEEVVSDEGSNEWRVTFGYDSNLDKELEKIVRVYKVFHIDADEGHFKGMFMREVGKM